VVPIILVEEYGFDFATIRKEADLGLGLASYIGHGVEFEIIND
jgi:hypothetical protein